MQPYSAPSFANAPLGTRCARHHDRSASTTCARCGDYCCDHCYEVGRDGMDYCAACRASASAPLASPWSRLAAQLINTFAAALTVSPFFFVGLLGAFSDPYTQDHNSNGDLLAGLAVFAVAGLGLTWIAVNVYLLHRDGQSIGKKVVGIRIVRVSGHPADIGRLVFLRYLFPALLGQVCTLFSIVDNLMVFSEDRRCIHDHFADTIVVECVGPDVF